MTASLDQIVEQFEDAWQRGQSPDIAAYLPERDERLAILIELVHVDLERRIKRGESIRIESYLMRFPELDEQSIIKDLIGAEFELRRRHDPDVSLAEYEQRFPQLGPLANSRTFRLPPQSPPSTFTAPSSNGTALVRLGPVTTSAGYDDLRPHAQGGLGEVFIAHDRALNRDVALKFLRRGHQIDDESRRRFLCEAEVTGRLEHPGIVPVYGLGQDAAGNPVYAMRFIRGQTFQEAIDRYHSGTARRSGERRVEFRQLVARFVSVCNTIAFAHTRGVIHRDLKPGNILLGEFGETIVVDWGMARVARDQESGASGVVDREPAADSSNAASTLPTVAPPTVQGTVFGTPGFMSPEQAAGDLTRVGVASDIYSLGAVLYALLTGRAPIGGAGLRETLERGRRGEFAPPREINCHVPAALEALCLKAMALEPEGRYPSALELARDLERWLAGEPVSAWREPVDVRVQRWVTRHATFAISTAIALVALAAIAGVTAVLHADKRLAELQQEHDRRELARREQEQYLHLVAQAGRAWQKGDVTGARRLLDRCKPELRHWEWHHLDRCLNRPSRIMGRHSAEAWAVAYNRDGTRLASAGLDGSVFIWDLTQPDAEPRMLPSNPHAIWSVAFHPDGVRVATAGDDAIVRIWDSTTLDEVQSFEAQGEILGVAFSADGKQIAASTGPGAARRRIGIGSTTIWDLGSGAKVCELTGHNSGIRAVVFAPDGKLITGGLDGVIKIWSPPATKPLKTIRAPARIHHLAVSPDGSCLASTSWDGTVRLWDLATGHEMHVLLAHRDSTWGVAFSADGSRLFTSSDDHTVRIWDVQRGSLLRTLRGHTGGIANVAVRPDGRQLASAADDQTVRLWDIEAPGEAHVFLGHSDRIHDVAVRADGRWAASAGEDRTIRVWDIAARREAAVLRHRVAQTCVAFQPDGPLLAYAGTQGEVRLWHIESQHEVRCWTAVRCAIWHIAFSPDGQRLAIAAEDGSVSWWDVDTGQPLGNCEAHQGQARCVAFSPNGHTIISGGDDKLVRAWDAQTGACLREYRGATSAILAVSYNPDGSVIAAATDRTSRVVSGDHGQVRLWDAATGEEQGLIAGHLGAVRGLTFIADETRIVTCGDDSTVKVWDRSGAELLSLSGHAPRAFHQRPTVSAIAVDPRGRFVLSAGHDGSVILWHGTEP